jgi:hypothetical protein
VGKPGRPGPTLDDYLYWQERLEGRGASGLSIDGFCLDSGRDSRIGKRRRRGSHVGRLGGTEVLGRDPDGITRRD